MGRNHAAAAGPWSAWSPWRRRTCPAACPWTTALWGGYNDNAMQFFWQDADQENRLEWVYLRTFTGGCIKYPPEKKRPPIIFPLADEDAYAYCDQSPCLECVFRCKRGFILYAYLSGVGLAELPIDRMDPYWQTKPASN